MRTKVCNVCFLEQPIDQYHFNKEYADNHCGNCKTCAAAYQKFMKLKRKKKQRKNTERFFYGRLKPLPPAPEHEITVQRGPITLVFD